MVRIGDRFYTIRFTPQPENSDGEPLDVFLDGGDGILWIRNDLSARDMVTAVRILRRRETPIQFASHRLRSDA